MAAGLKKGHTEAAHQRIKGAITKMEKDGAWRRRSTRTSDPQASLPHTQPPVDKLSGHPRRELSASTQRQIL